MTGIVQAFEGHTARHSTITDHCDNMTVIAVQLLGAEKSKRCRNRGAAMAYAKCIIFTFTLLRETCNTAILTKRIESVFSSGEKFIGIGLMSHVPDDLVVRRGKLRKKRNSKLDGTEIGSQVAAVFRDAVHDHLTKFRGEALALVITQ